MGELLNIPSFQSPLTESGLVTVVSPLATIGHEPQLLLPSQIQHMTKNEKLAESSTTNEDRVVLAYWPAMRDRFSKDNCTQTSTEAVSAITFSPGVHFTSYDREGERKRGC